ncbi:hypothetical protein V6N11_013167 [Hibiscus sabdariffa]|uniref:Uncharacterized protein n=1 Tax=Hibiscus sabdariffa TaxID=183260 RepID=A0ABR2NF32_9ROSI
MGLNRSRMKVKPGKISPSQRHASSQDQPHNIHFTFQDDQFFSLALEDIFSPILILERRSFFLVLGNGNLQTGGTLPQPEPFCTTLISSSTALPPPPLRSNMVISSHAAA